MEVKREMVVSEVHKLRYHQSPQVNTMRMIEGTHGS